MQEIQPQLNELMERARISQSMGLASDAGKIRDEMMVRFLSSPAAEYITGQVLGINGGYVI